MARPKQISYNEARKLLTQQTPELQFQIMDLALDYMQENNSRSKSWCIAKAVTDLVKGYILIKD